MKKIIVFSTLALTFTTSAFAFNNPVNPEHPGRGIFVGGDIGYGHYSAPSNNLSDLNAFAWYINIGFQFNPYIALEGGYMQLNGLKVGANNVSTKADVHGDSLLAKLTYPFRHKYSVFAKFGFMEVYAQTTSNAGVSANIQAPNHATPEFGLGGGYKITQNLTGTLQWLTTFSTGSSPALPATNLALIGLHYQFNM